MRKSKHHYFIDMASLSSSRATCSRRMVGCVLVNSRGHILSTGYNGPPSGMPHCTDKPCGGAGFKSGEGLDACEAVHAEQNALLQCPDVQAIEIAYVTTAPCITCTKLLLNTSCETIIFKEDYPHADAAKALWEASGRRWEKYTD